MNTGAVSSLNRWKNVPISRRIRRRTKVLLILKRQRNTQINGYGALCPCHTPTSMNAHHSATTYVFHYERRKLQPLNTIPSCTSRAQGTRTTDITSHLCDHNEMSRSTALITSNALAHIPHAFLEVIIRQVFKQ